MKVILAFDKFKGSATARQLCDAACQALDAFNGMTAVAVPVADGGDGTTAVLADACQGQWVTAPVMAPLLHLDPVPASYFITDDGTALIEVAAASGLARVPAHERNVMRASTLGTGMLMRDAMERGCRHIVLGLGGSATCDAAMGIMCALGVEFHDAQGRYLFPCGESLDKIARIETMGVPPAVLDCRYTLLTDVDNPLCGVRGSASVFAPQKGASPEQVEQLERGMAHVAEIVGDDIATRPGCGAAGGVPALMMHLLNCELLPGAPYILERNGYAEALENADFVITGEGRLDRQTMMGKGPGHVIAMARERGVPVMAVCGTIEDGFDPARAGLARAVAVSTGLPQEEAMDTDATLVRVSQAVGRLIKEMIQDDAMVH